MTKEQLKLSSLVDKVWIYEKLSDYVKTFSVFTHRVNQNENNIYN